MLLEECKYIVKVKKISKYINDNLEIFSNDFGEDASEESDYSDEEACNEDRDKQ